MSEDPSRGQFKRKWHLDRSRGPVGLAAELVQKKLIQHFWPCDYELERVDVLGDVARFRSVVTGYGAPDFVHAFWVACRVVAADTGALLVCADDELWLQGPHRINKQGKLVRCKS